MRRILVSTAELPFLLGICAWQWFIKDTHKYSIAGTRITGDDEGRYEFLIPENSRGKILAAYLFPDSSLRSKKVCVDFVYERFLVTRDLELREFRELSVKIMYNVFSGEDYAFSGLSKIVIKGIDCRGEVVLELIYDK